jgi:hypothetical protein
MALYNTFDSDSISPSHDIQEAIFGPMESLKLQSPNSLVDTPKTSFNIEFELRNATISNPQRVFGDTLKIEIYHPANRFADIVDTPGIVERKLCLITYSRPKY